MRAHQFQKSTCRVGSTGCQPVRLGSVPRRFLTEEDSRCEYVVGKLPATAGWQPALPRLRRADKGIHFFGELFEHGRIGCRSVA